MGDTGVDIDLYADVEDFPAEELEQESNDLYDDVLASASDVKEEKTTPIKSEPPQSSSSASSMSMSSSSLAGGPGARRYQLYIGNLTWWTTDQDIQDAVQSVGVNDFLEVKFYENRANGQSKGFCCISLASENSMRVVMDKLPQKELHSQAPVVTYATKQALHQFEAQSKTRPPQSAPPGRGPPPSGGPPRMMGPSSGRGPPPGIRPSSFNRPPPSIRPSGPPGIPHMSAPPPGIPLGAPPPMGGGIPPRTLPPGVPPGPAPHVNPAFFAHGPPPGVGGYPVAVAAPHGLSEVEFEEIMSRNRTVSSSAIARAVQDAANGEYASAIETLVTAISLIKQSKVANDDRCKILISSLQDTLHGIENKSYGGRGGPPRDHHHERDRERERHRADHHRDYYRSREREYRDHHYRERSRSRERDYRRERERDYYEEKERYEKRLREDRERLSGEGRRERREEHERERPEGRSSERERRRE